MITLKTFREREGQIMMMHVSCNDCTATRPATTVEAVISFAFTSAARFFSVLRFYFYAFIFTRRTPV